MRTATDDLSWLLTRGYASVSSLKLVGDRYALKARQRLAVSRCAASDLAVARRKEREMPVASVEEAELWIDGFNVLTSVEAALSGGVILHARDGCYRDMASVHGSYRQVAETVAAIDIIGRAMVQWRIKSFHWFLDRPVSNSGRTKKLLEETARKNHWEWSASVIPDPDSVLKSADHVVATADSQVLDCVARWFNLAKLVIDGWVDDARVVDLS